MQSKWLVKSASALAMVAVMATETMSPIPAYAGVPGVFATEYTQLLNYAELAGQLEKQVLMVENQLNQLADMAKHGITITNQLFGTVASDINNLNQIVKTGQSLSYTMSNLDGSFRLRFPGYSSSTNYGQSYQTWSQTSLDSTRGTLNAAGLQNSQFNSDEALLKTLQGQSQSAVGRMQAIEVGNQIAENQSEQLMKLRQLMMADIQSKAAYQGALVQAEATKQGAVSDRAAADTMRKGREQGQQGAGEEHCGSCSQQHNPHGRGEADVSDRSNCRTCYGLRWRSSLDGRSLPTRHRENDPNKRYSVQYECGADARKCNHQAGQGGPDGAGEIEFDAVERRSCREVFLVNQLRQDGAPGRRFKCVSRRQSEGQKEK